MSNLLKRSISGVVFILIMVGALLFNELSYIILMTFIMVVATAEYFKLCGQQHFSRVTMVLSLTASLFLLYCSTMIVLKGISPSYLIVTLIPLLLIPVSALYNKRYNIHNNDNGIRKSNGYEMMPWAFSAFCYIGIPIAMTTMVIADNQGEYTGKLLLSMFIILWSCDVGAYLLGSSIGQKFNNRLFPSISPKKTWIGFSGAVISAVITGVILQSCNLLQMSLVDTLIISVIISVFGVLGDLVESQLKRNFGVKDSGNIIPGHGGMLDRFDGVLLAFPIAIVYIYLFI